MKYTHTSNNDDDDDDDDDDDKLGWFSSTQELVS